MGVTKLRILIDICGTDVSIFCAENTLQIDDVITKMPVCIEPDFFHPAYSV